MPTPPLGVYCLGNTGIKLHYSEDERFQFGLFYPDKECSADLKQEHIELNQN
jgi:hypothetical protein